MPESFQSLSTIGYLVAAILFILSLGGLSKQETAKRGNVYGIIGMILAIVVTFAVAMAGDQQLAWGWAVGPIVVGGLVGALLAARVAMTAMPELVAILHSFVGLAAVLVGFSTFLDAHGGSTVHLIEIYVDVAIGAITFTGSVVAWGKLSGNIGSAPLRLPGRHVLNLAMTAAVIGFGVVFVQQSPLAPTYTLGINAGIAAVVGVHLVMAIGGADMPVVVSLLNSYSGWAAAAAGFMLANDLLIITGALVGSSGAILSYIMCRGMDRSLVNVIFGGFGTEDSDAGGSNTEGAGGDAQSASAPEVADRLKRAERVVIVPGYGMAVAQAQHAISQLTQRLRDAGTEVVFAIHPVAGRMPGHMNVLLAEADIPYDIVHEMEDVNDTFPDTDVALVVGANDIVNPEAKSDKSSPIYGMPQIEVWEADRVVVCKRSLSPGYAGVPNPLFFRDNTWMYFGDAKESINKLFDAM